MRAESKHKNPNFLAAMAAAGMSTLDLAKSSGISRGTISRLICQRGDALPSTLFRLAKVLGCRPKDLVPGAEGGAK